MPLLRTGPGLWHRCASVHLPGNGPGAKQPPDERASRLVRLLCWAGLATAAILHTTLARADVEPIGIDYSAPEGCPSADEFTTQVLERTDSARLSSELGVRTFVVAITRGEGEVEGSLSIRESDGSSSFARNLKGSHCAEVAMALALATALAIDPQATFAPREDEPPPALAEPPLQPLPADPVDRVEPPKGGSDRRALALAIGPALMVGVAPVTGFGGVVAGESRSPGPIVAAIGVDLTLLTAPTARTSGAQSSFDIAHVQPRICLFPVPSATKVRVMPCFGAELGVQRGRGSDLPRPLEATRLWAAASVGPRLSWDLDDDWFVDFSGDAVVPFTRYRFVFEEPETSIHQASPVVLQLSLRFGAKL